MVEYDWEQIISQIKAYARIEDITDIILLGNNNGEGVGIRRLKLDE